GPRAVTVALFARPSRLVFGVPPGARLPCTVEGLLDWSGLTPLLHPIAAIPPQPTAGQIAAAPPITEPTAAQTALELPYRLWVSPNGDAGWLHRIPPFTVNGRTELWHTRLVLPNAGQLPRELSAAATAPLRAIWSPDFAPTPKTTDRDRFLARTAMSPNDRHQIVILTSAFHGYEVDEELSLSVPSG